MTHRPHGLRIGQLGFSMIEVMVTLVVVSIGLLGVSKLQAASVSNTQVARVRSLLSLQAGSLAAAMHANPSFWASGTAPASFSVAAKTVTDSSGILDVALPDCTTAICTPAQIAALDVQTWASNLNDQLPTYSGTVTCTSTAPVGCQISLTWREKYVATNTSTAQVAQSAQAGTPTFTLFVSP